MKLLDIIRKNLFELNKVVSRKVDPITLVGSAFKDEWDQRPMLTGDRVPLLKSWKVPIFSSTPLHDFSDSSNANKYLFKQMNRINKAINDGNVTKAIKI